MLLERVKPESILLILVTILVSIGIIMIYSSSAIYAEKYWNSHSRFILRHLVFLGFGLVLFRIAIRFSYEGYKKSIPLFLVVTFVLLILVLIPGIGKEVSGARRWIRFFGVGFQPSELLKLSMLFWISGYLDRRKVQLSNFSRGLLPTFIVFGIYIFLLLLQPDFGTSVLLSLLLLLMTFVAGVKPLHIIGSILGLASVSFLLIISQAYRLRRISAFLDPWADPFDSGFQLVQSFIAYGSGGLLGRGLGNSRQKLFFLPEAHTDFIFSIYAEETGFIGVSFMLFVLVLFLVTGLRISMSCRDDFGRNLSFGITTLVTLQSLMHIGVVTGLLPTKGIPLPFISYGGSSLLLNLFIVGILINIAKSNREHNPAQMKNYG